MNKRLLQPDCHCINIDFGSYDNQVIMIAPFDLYTITGKLKHSREVAIDSCIATDIAFLWHKGVITLNSCCGHNKLTASVVVADQSIEVMERLGYKRWNVKCANPNNTFEL